MSKKKRKFKKVIDNPFGDIIRCLVDYVRDRGKFSLARVESILYDDVIVDRIRALNLMFTSGQAIDELIKFVSYIEPIKGVRAINWLFKDRITQQFKTEDKRQKWLVGDEMINIIKEIVWVTYYIATKERCDIRLFGTPFECLNRILSIDLDLRKPAEDFGLDRNKFITNILSLKDSRYKLLAYPDNICSVDLEIIVLNNNLVGNEGLLWAIKSLDKKKYEPYEHYHMFEFVRNLVIEALDGRAVL